MNGATIGVDESATRVLDGEIYALEHDGMLRVKYLYRLPAGGMCACGASAQQSTQTKNTQPSRSGANKSESLAGYFGEVKRSKKERPLPSSNKQNKQNVLTQL
ncbi:hypothetical protein P4050_00565 [Pseudomonas aeruginosa]|nr:hypothetical protein [Pseudomonas aeruginosa]